ncbi:uncharacterized protein LOC131934849 [Physella acuta]|uniref:uncharacterized protein LOC131934849 n=1 Tax=Physella acuta TaxID=109671 RepID=UPI0027DD60DD|nr:uncharacterized protein LOC131934849 [Physella acuta]XP_059146974.1 uncharacterized protein LOC131934849 [Physella acuta]XP_059146975.1 uncharacterized protein LOC131934849 [Physella acuta]
MRDAVSWSFRVLVLVLLCKAQVYIVEQGDNLTFSCDSRQTIAWFNSPSMESRIGTCRVVNNVCYTSYPEYALEASTFRTTDGFSLIRSLLTVKYVTREMEYFVCASPKFHINNIISTFRLQVVARPTSITCNKATYDSTGQVIIVICQFEVYPKGTCSVAELLSPLQLEVDYFHRFSNLTKNYRTTCGIRVLAGAISSSTWRQLHVVMAPELNASVSQYQETREVERSPAQELKKSPWIILFTANEKTGDVFVEKGSAVTFRCESLSVPALRTTLYKTRLFDVTSVVEVARESNSLGHDITDVDCDDAATYTCQDSYGLDYIHVIHLQVSDCGSGSSPGVKDRFPLALSIALPLIAVILTVTILLICLLKRHKSRRKARSRQLHLAAHANTAVVYTLQQALDRGTRGGSSLTTSLDPPSYSSLFTTMDPPPAYTETPHDAEYTNAAFVNDAYDSITTESVTATAPPDLVLTVPDSKDQTVADSKDSVNVSDI